MKEHILIYYNGPAVVIFVHFVGVNLFSGCRL